MIPGPDLDLLVGRELMGCHVKRRRGRYGDVFDLAVPGSFDRVDYADEAGAWAAMPPYSTDIAAAMTVLEKFDGWRMQKLPFEEKPLTRYRVSVGDYGRELFSGWASAATVAHAICLAALQTKRRT